MSGCGSCLVCRMSDDVLRSLDVDPSARIKGAPFRRSASEGTPQAPPDAPGRAQAPAAATAEAVTARAWSLVALAGTFCLLLWRLAEHWACDESATDL